jgi:HEAT repeat protein
MLASLATTWQVLSKSRNDSVTDALLPLLSSADADLVEKCVQTLARRRDGAGHRGILTRLGTFSESIHTALAELPGRMTDTLRAAIGGKDPELFENALEAVRRLDEYEVIPSLVRALETEPAKSDAAAATLLHLAEHLSEELAGRRRPKDHRDPQRMWGQALSSLQDALGRTSTHERREVAQAFLMLTPRNSKTLTKILGEPNHACHPVLIEILQSSCDPQLLAHLLAVILRPRAPQAAVDILGRRCDLTFIRCVLSEIAACRDELLQSRKRLAHIDRIDWLRNDRRILDELDSTEQEAAVTLAVASAIGPAQKLSLLGCVLENGAPDARRAACAALAEFKGEHVDQLVLRALHDDCPEVQAAAICQLRQRGIPDAINRIMEFLESGHDLVQDAARASLADFTVDRFRAAFDEMNDETRSATGELVRRVDASLPDALRQDILCPSRARRLRAIEMARVSGAVAPLERELIASLDDEDHFIRSAAAAALGQSNTFASRMALRSALSDRSVGVRQAARDSLDHLLAGSEAWGAGSLAASKSAAVREPASTRVEGS